MGKIWIIFTGLSLLLACALAALWWVEKGEAPGKTMVTVFIALAVAGVVLILHERLESLSISRAGLNMVLQQAKEDASDIASIRERVANQSATIDRVANEATEAKGLAEEAKGKLTKVESTLNASEQSLLHLQEIITFTMTLNSAQTDDRKAFEQLEEWSSDSSYPYHETAKRTHHEILRKYNEPIHINWQYPFPDEVDTDSLSLLELAGLYHSPNLQSTYKSGLINFIWSRKDLPKDQKESLLVNIIRTDESLLAVSTASRILIKEYNLAFHTLAVKSILRALEEK